MVTDDFEYLVDNVQLDMHDIVTAPLHLTSENSVLRSPRFYLTLAGAGAVWGGAFALDQTMRSHLHTMSSSDADLLQNVSYGSIGASAALLYAYGFYNDDARIRQGTLTGGEGAGVGSLANVGIKAAFGRLRPKQGDHSHTAFFRGGGSFVSGDVTPLFGLAAGISESFNNEWYVAAPAYSLALLDGFGRMGHDAHWFSDVVGAGLLGWGTTDLFLYLHHEHESEPGRWRGILRLQCHGASLCSGRVRQCRDGSRLASDDTGVHSGNGGRRWPLGAERPLGVGHRRRGVAGSRYHASAPLPS
ncbi:MAG: phosphatase PAP2 family protein [Candidatus Binatia bacterium]|jgi:membrane-associated phospholipid phosphatase